MLFHKATKTAFVMPIKTGSTSACAYLNQIGFKYISADTGYAKSIRHAFPKDVLQDYPALKSYKFYGFFRNPLDRFLSILSMFQQHGIKLKYSDFADKQRNDVLLDIHVANQVEWLDNENTTALDFEKFDQELQAIGKKHGRPDVKVQKLNAGAGSIEVTDDLKNFVRSFYASDYKFAKEVLQKEF